MDPRDKNDDFQTMMRQEYPIHSCIWFNNIEELQNQLEKLNENCVTHEQKERRLEKCDPRGRTPLLLSLSLGRCEMAQLLIDNGVNLASTDRWGFNPLHEAILTRDSNLVRQILCKRDEQRATKRLEYIPEILSRLRDTPDFYVEMKWEFSSWLPLVSRVCPSDIYKIYKSGSNVRVDTTLVGFDGSWNWLRGHRSFVFKAGSDKSQFIIINHDNGKYLTRDVTLSSSSASTSNYSTPTKNSDKNENVTHGVQFEDTQGGLNINQAILEEMVQSRMASPIKISYIDTDQIRFDRTKCGILGFRTDKSETINGYDCQVYTATNIESISRIRIDHLNETERAEALQEESESFETKLAPIQCLLSGREVQRIQPPENHYQSKIRSDSISVETGPMFHDQKSCSSKFLAETGESSEFNPFNISFSEYFDSNLDLKDKDIGQYKDMTSYIQKFKANVWMCDEFPLSLHEQIQPIIDLMALNSAHFAKLKDFISLQLPQGFPVKIEIPLFHLVTAVITFGNIFALEQNVAGVTSIKDETTTACVVDDCTFDPPSGYTRAGEQRHRYQPAQPNQHQSRTRQRSRQSSNIRQGKNFPLR